MTAASSASRNSSDLPPGNAVKTVRTATPAVSAICLTVVLTYPRSTKSRAAASTIVARVRRAASSRSGEL